jgi:hypothetical protein
MRFCLLDYLYFENVSRGGKRKLKDVSAGLGTCELLSEIRTFRPGAYCNYKRPRLTSVLQGQKEYRRQVLRIATWPRLEPMLITSYFCVKVLYSVMRDQRCSEAEFVASFPVHVILCLRFTLYR